jgi:hypothetical protein
MTGPKPRTQADPRTRRILIGVGAGACAVAALAVAGWLLVRPGPDDDAASGPGELSVQTGLNDDPKLDPGHPLKCFVNGQAVGELPLRDCARRNGVDPGALDVGLDANGVLGASNGLNAALTPLPPPGDEAAGPGAQVPTAPGQAPGQAPVQATARTTLDADAAGPCWRYGDGGWSRLPEDGALGACIQTLFAGQCEPTGAVAYGRWHGRTLRLVTGRVEMMGDDRAFHPIAAQNPDCSIPTQG